MILTDRTRNEVDLECRRKRFYFTEYAGWGIVPKFDDLALAFGIDIHQVDEDLDEQMDPADAAHAAGLRMKKAIDEAMIQEPMRTEYPLLAEALTYAYRKYVLPDILKDYDIWSTEQEVAFEDDGVRWMTRPDRLFLHKKYQHLMYQEKKSTGLDPSTFSRIWERKAQLHIGARAVEQTLDMPVESVVVQGFWKGPKYKGHLRSRLLGGYRREGIAKTTYRLDHAKGFEWFLASEYPGGVTAWIDEQLSQEAIAENFPSTPPIAPNAKYLDSYLKQRNYREKEIYGARTSLELIADDVAGGWAPEEAAKEVDRILTERFPQNTDACEDPITRSKCPYYEICWNQTVGKDPLGSGLYKPREPHHAEERIIWLRSLE